MKTMSQVLQNSYSDPDNDWDFSDHDCPTNMPQCSQQQVRPCRSPPRKSSFVHRDMISRMMAMAEEQGRDFLDDALKLIIAYYSSGTNNMHRIISHWKAPAEQKKHLITLANLYGIRNAARYHNMHPTLARVAEALPHLSLMLCDRLNAKCSLGPWASDAELGATVSYHFKMNYFPGLIDTKECGPKAQLGLFLFNVCQTRAIMKTSEARMNPIRAFVASCLFASGVMAQELAPAKSREKFTKFIITLPIDAHLMDAIWTTVMGDVQIMVTATTSFTQFHQNVLMAQPLNLKKWKKLLTTDMY